MVPKAEQEQNDYLLLHLKHQRVNSFFHHLTGCSVTDRSSGQILVCFHIPGHSLHSDEGKDLPLIMIQNDNWKRSCEYLGWFDDWITCFVITGPHT